MGRQADERQDDLFNLRVTTGRLVGALVLAFSDDPVQMRTAEQEFLDMVQDPLVAKRVLPHLTDDVLARCPMLQRVKRDALIATTGKPYMIDAVA